MLENAVLQGKYHRNRNFLGEEGYVYVYITILIMILFSLNVFCNTSLRIQNYLEFGNFIIIFQAEVVNILTSA